MTIITRYFTKYHTDSQKTLLLTICFFITKPLLMPKITANYPIIIELFAYMRDRKSLFQVNVSPTTLALRLRSAKHVLIEDIFSLNAPSNVSHFLKRMIEI